MDALDDGTGQGCPAHPSTRVHLPSSQSDTPSRRASRARRVCLRGVAGRAAVAVGLVLALAAPLAAAPAGEFVPGEILVRYRAATAPPERVRIERAIQARVLRTFPGPEVTHLRLEPGVDLESALAALRSDPGVVYAEPNRRIHAAATPDDPLFPSQHALRNTGQAGGLAGADIDATTAWNYFTGFDGLEVGVLDTGIEYDHPDLADNIWFNLDEQLGDSGADDDGNGLVDDIRGYDFVNDDGDPRDDNQHGTLVAGVIGAYGNNGAGISGVLWRCRMVALKVLNGAGVGSVDAVLAALQYATTIGVKVSCSSWVTTGFSQALLDGIEDAGAAGMLFVAAAGNGDPGADLDQQPVYPAAYDSPYILSVGASTRRDSLAVFSNWGAASVDLVAPGEEILSTELQGRYLATSGTSLAAAHAAGVCAMAAGHFPHLGNLQIKDLVMRSVDVRASLVGKVVSGGRLDAATTVGSPDSEPPGPITDLAVSTMGSTTAALHWTAPGDDGVIGQVQRYEVRHSAAPITAANFAQATLAGGPTPHSAGTLEHFEVTGLAPLTSYFFAVRAFDENLNGGDVSNNVTGTTLGPPLVSVAPASLGATLVTGASETRTIRLRNVGQGLLDFEIPALQFQALEAPGRDDERVATPEGSGGPDGFGYRWIDSDQPGGPSFRWLDPTANGEPVAIAGDDSVCAAIPIGFPFPFYGARHTTVRIGSDGYLSFTDSTEHHGANLPLPNASAPASMIAPFWDDLDLGATPRVFAQREAGRFTVSWVGVPHRSTGGPYTFQAMLYPSGEIRFQYLSLGASPQSATIGLQNASRTSGLTVVRDTAYAHDSLAIRLRPLTEWLTVSPTSGRVAAGDSLDLALRFDASGLPGGYLSAEVVIETNIAGQEPTRVPVRLMVVPYPDLAVDSSLIAFGSQFTGFAHRRSVTVRNEGVLDLGIVTSSDHAALAASPGQLTVPPGESRVIDITFQSAAPLVLDATVRLTSNDADDPVHEIRVTAEAVTPPLGAVRPASIERSLLSNRSTSVPLWLSNVGGSTLTFDARAMRTPAPGGFAVHDAHAPEQAGSGGPGLLRSGGPDRYGYTYIDSDHVGGPTMEWIDVRTEGQLLPLIGDNANAGPFEIGFPFPFYGDTFTTFRASTDGFVSFSSSLANPVNEPLPHSGPVTPRNLLAVFWDNFIFGTIPRVWFHSDARRAVIQYQEATRVGDVLANTFEIVLYPDGRILYQYLDLSPENKDHATVGIQNGAGDDGLQVVYNAPYLKDGLVILFQPPQEYVTVTPLHGAVMPGDSLELLVGLDATRLGTGVYHGVVRITSNDPVHPVLDVPVRLDVQGAPDLQHFPAELRFGDVFVGYHRDLTLQIDNVGTTDLVVTSMASSDPAYHADPFSTVVAPFARAVVTVRFSPAGGRPHPATLLIASNDPDVPSLAIPLVGTGLVPPAVSVTPESLRVALATTLGPEQRTAERRIVIANGGGSPLSWTVEPFLVPEDPGPSLAASAEASRPLDAEAPKGAPDEPGIPALAAGGPDAFGYAWSDSRDQNGPSFSWVDISETGSRVMLEHDDQNSGPIALGFSFPFYGQLFDSVRVCSNGWLSFTSGDNTYSNVGLPNAGNRTPENLVAPFWDDLDPRRGGAIYAQSDGSRLVVSYHDLPHWVESGRPAPGRYTFQVTLHRSGEINFQYLLMQGNDSSATIGIQNATKTVGLRVAYNTRFARDSVRVRIARGTEWLQVLDPAGVTGPGETDTVRVRMDAEDLAGADHVGSLEVESNDPVHPRVLVPVLLHVGVRDGRLDFSASHPVAGPAGGWMRGRLEVPGECQPERIVPSSVRVAGLAPTGATPASLDGCGAVFGFDRVPMLAALGSGEAVVVEAIGLLDEVTWFSAIDTIPMLPPELTRPPGPYAGGAPVALSWTDAPGSAPSAYDLWFSADSGRTWTPVVTQLAAHDFQWTVPAAASPGAFLELVAFDPGGRVVGITHSGPFAITGGAVEPEAVPRPRHFGIAMAGPNPAPGHAELRLSLPSRSEVSVQVFDVRGGLVRRLVRAELDAGEHSIGWDGRADGGSRAGPGLYFVRATALGLAVRTRLVLVR